jgi:GntR family transcriptional regulator of gluconate operon
MDHVPEKVPSSHLEVERLPELCYRAIRDWLLTGRFDMGERLNESRIAQELGVSRGPVREAVRRLRHDGLVVDRPRQGAFVRCFGAQDVKNIYNLRMAIETTAARLVIQRQAGTDGLEEIVARMAKAAAEGDAAACVDIEFAFHERLCALSGNQYLLDAFRMVSGPVRVAMSLDNASLPELSNLPGEHIRLVEMLRAGDESAVAAEIEAHIMAHFAELLEKLGATTDGRPRSSGTTVEAPEAQR